MILVGRVPEIKDEVKLLVQQVKDLPIRVHHHQATKASLVSHAR